MSDLDKLRESLANPSLGTSTGQVSSPVSPTPLRFVQPPVEQQRKDSGKRQFNPTPRYSPFEVIGPATPSSAIRAQIYLYSYLRSNIGDEAPITIGGLATDFSISIGDKIWLELDIDEFTVTEANISATGSGDTWTDYPNAAVYDGDGSVDDPYDLQKVYIPIAFCVDPVSDDPLRYGRIFTVGGSSVKVIQVLNYNLELFYTVKVGKALLYARHGTAPMPLT